jgi:hypothetical protein
VIIFGNIFQSLMLEDDNVDEDEAEKSNDGLDDGTK